MLIILDQRLFATSEGQTPLLLSLFLAANERGHSLLMDPPWEETDRSQPVNRWKQALGERVDLAIEGILLGGLEDFTTLTPGGRARRLRIAPIQTSRWEGGEVSPADGLRLMWTPLWLALENGRNDLQFLRRMLTSAELADFEAHLQAGRIEVPLGGGTGELTCFLKDLATAPPQNTTAWIRRLRTWVLFDRDAHADDRTRPSKESDRLLDLCQAMSTPHRFPGHQLGRRTIENYLPYAALDHWAQGGHDRAERDRRRAVTQAFKSGSFGPQRRHCYSMKEGLLKDSPHAIRKQHSNKEYPGRAPDLPLGDADVALVFRGLPDQMRQDLKKGFGLTIGELFHVREIEDRWFHEVFTQDPDAAAWRRQVVESLWEVL